ncbi:uncharacterized protein [Primulina huaijiensis]|uniref:uncharacterized protein n=1 Tax=Primulina huaijiensis TaxID=1492673 RepID=UPI003CC77FF3
MSNSSNEGSDNSAVVFWVFGCVCAFAILLCWIPACLRRTNAPKSSKTSQAAPAAVNGGSAQKDRDLTIDVTEPAVAVIDIAAESAGAGCGGGCCCAGGGCGDGGGCGGCGGD